MATRTPPNASHSFDAKPIIAFEKSSGTVSSTFIGRIILRVPIHLRLQSGKVINAVRYSGKFWPIYDPTAFNEKTRHWIADGDTVYDENHSSLSLPIKHPFLFDCDNPHGGYER